MLHDGEFFGELSLLDGETRSASAVAVVETILLCLEHEAFYSALKADCFMRADRGSTLERRRRGPRSERADRTGPRGDRLCPWLGFRARQQIAEPRKPHQGTRRPEFFPNVS